MQNIKNFQLVPPAPELVAYMPEFATALHLESEDGRDWYACQSGFADDTIKIMYDENGVIRSVVDKPVPQRGNVYAVSMLFPDGFSVSEISQADWPTDFRLDGTWKFDDETVYQDIDVVSAKAASRHAGRRSELVNKAAAEIAMIQCGAAVGCALEGDKKRLARLQSYVHTLRHTNPGDELPSYPADL